MSVYRHEGARAKLRGAAIFVVLLNLLLGGLPVVGALDGATTRPGGQGAAPVGAPGALESPTRSPWGPSELAPAALAPPVPMAPPVMATNGSPKNWTPYSPSAFTMGSSTVTYAAHSFAFATLPNVTANQSGNLTVGFNGSWNPAPAGQSDRDWVMLVVARNGTLSTQVLESNTTFRFALNSSQIPFWCFFALPTPVASASPTSNAFATVRDANGNTTRLNLTMANAGLTVSGGRALLSLPTQSVWFNASGSYTTAAPVSAAVDFAVVLPTDGSQPFSAKAASVHNFVGAANFSGARMFLLKPTATSLGVGTVRVTVWTRGSPESGLNVNATLSPTAVYREDNLTAAGVLGNRSLVNSTNWTVNTSPQAPPQRDSENCNAAVRTTTGQWRMFCAYSDSPGLGTIWGVDSAISSDGVSWLWEAGSRFSLCGGSHVFTQLAVYRQLDNSLRMYFGGSWGLLTCTALGSGQIISSATSTDEGLTWNLESEPIDVGLAAPDVRAVVPTPDGKLRMFFDSNSGMATALSEDGLNWYGATPITTSQARAAYLLTDGTYKMYYGTTSISSRTSRDGITWNPAQVEIASWGPSIEAGPIIDRGDGALYTVFYSQTGGIFAATLGGTARAAAPVVTNGTLSDGRDFGAANFTAAANGSFERNFTVPADAPLGRVKMVVGGWFGGPTLRSVVLNRVPEWTGPSVVNATEDALLSLNLANWSIEDDTVDTLNFTAASAYGAVNGTLLNLTYLNGVLSELVFGNITDGNDTTPFNFTVNVTPFDDAPTLTVNATYTADEDAPMVIDFAGLYADEETAAALLNLSTNAPGATVSGSNISFLFALPGNYTITIGVSDGNNTVNRTTLFIVNAVNDAPTLMLPPLYQGFEDAPITIDFGPVIDDEDNADGELIMFTDLPGANISGLNITVMRNAPAVIPFNISVFDGAYNITRATTLEVLPVPDAPTLNLDPLYTGNEDSVIVLDFTNAIDDEDTPLSALNFSTNLSGAVSGFTVTLTRNRAMVIPFSVTVSDGNTSVTRNSVLEILEVNDPPVWVSVPTAPGLVEDTFLIVDLQLFVTDEDNTTDTLVFFENSSFAQIFGSDLHLLYPNAVLGDSIVLSVWDGTSNRTVIMNVTVQPVNDPPMIQGTPPTTLDANGTILFQFDVTDVDSAGAFHFELTANQTWISLSDNGLLNITPPPGTHGRFNYTVIVRDAQGLASFPRTFTVESATNALPVMEPDFTRLSANATLSRPFSVQFNVTDPDNDIVTAVAIWGDTNQNITLTRLNGTRWSFNWTPNYPGVHPQPFVEWLNGTLLLNDTFGVARYPFAIRVTDPPNHKPVITQALNITVYEGNDTVIDLTNYGHDEDEYDTIDVLVWSFNLPPSTVFNWSFNATTRMLTIQFGSAGDASGLVTLTDPSHESDTRPISIHAVPVAGVPSGGSNDFPWWLLLLLLIAGGVIGGLVYWRSRASPAGDVPLTQAEPGSSAASAAESTAASPRTAAGAASRGKFMVEDLFLLYRDGRTIFTRSGLGADAIDDPESVGAMLIAVQDFVKDSFRKGDPVDRMGYGDSVILLEKGENVLLAVTVYGEPDRDFKEMLKDIVGRIEGTYAGNIEHWSGDRTDFIGIESILSPIWILTASLTRGDVLLATTAREVQMLSGVEFFQGYVRVKVGIVNNTATVITGITVDLDYNADVLRLHKVEPATYKIADSKVSIGVLHTGEKSTLAYYFDPQICTSSAIEGTCRYKDADGKQHIVQMKTRKAEVVCPLFFTKEQANTAMLKRLLETEVKQFDVRAYSFREGARDAELRDLFEALKSAVAVHDVQVVRSFEKRRPYVAEGWFYGKTQVKGYPVIVRVVVDQSKGRAEFFVASVAMKTITGLLAELHHTFQTPMGGPLGGLGLKALFDESVKAEYASTTAASKMVEGEAASGDNEPA